MASKEVMVSAPLVTLLYDRIFISGSFKESLRRRWGVYLALAATWAVLGLMVYLSPGRGGSAGFGLGMTAWEYARTQFGCIIHYLRLAFWPDPLVLDYGTATVSSAAEIIPYAVGVGLLLAATAVALARRPKWGFLGVWFFAILAPTSSLVPLAGQTEAEHRMYLPLAAVVTLVVLAAYAVLERLGRRAGKADATLSPSGRAAAVVLIVAVAAALGWGTYQRNEVYRSALAIWNYTIEKCPLNCRAYTSRGHVLSSEGQYDAAIKDYDTALERKPDYAVAYIYRGNALNSEGRYDAAIKDYDKAAELKPDDAEIYYNRGVTYYSKGQYDAAIKDYDRALERKPDYAEAYYSRGVALNHKGRYEAAISDYDKALERKPDDAQAYNNRGNAYYGKGQYDAAIKDYDKALSLKPDDAETYYNRAVAYFSKGQYEAAIKDYDKALSLKSDDAGAYYNRAIAHFLMKDYDKAWADVKMYRKLGGTPDPKLIGDLTRDSGRSE